MEMNRGCLMTVGVSLGGLAMLLTAAFFVLNPEKKVLDSRTRVNLPGEFITLSDGVTHYDLSGPPNGPVVVLVHGFSVPGFAWERNVPALTEAGFRVLTLDLYGRGYSDRPDVTYDLDLYIRQIDELLTALKIYQPVDIAGISLGGYIAAAFTNQYPQKVQRLILISPQSESMSSDLRLKIVTLPLIGDFLFPIYIEPYQVVDAQNAFAAYMPSSDWHDRELDAMSYKGESRALLSTLRSMTGDPLAEYRAVGQLGKPIELLWGDEDHTNSYSNVSRVLDAMPQAEFFPIPGARHMSIYEKPEVVNPLMIQFLKGK
jgi:pimeloyl-ACP methyl ester carboxylesterase